MPFEYRVNSFAFGEFSPEIYGRTDLPQYRSAAATLKNVVVQPQGAVTKRPGTKHLATRDYPARLISFQTGANTSYAVELSDGMIRVLDQDGVQQFSDSTSVPFATANLWTTKYVQAAQDMIFVDRSYAPHRLNFDGSTWTFSALPIVEPGITPGFDVSTANRRPGAVTFNDQRIVLGGTDQYPNAIFGSGIQALQLYVDGKYVYTKRRTWWEDPDGALYDSDSDGLPDTPNDTTEQDDQLSRRVANPGDYWTGPTSVDSSAPSTSSPDEVTTYGLEQKVNFYANPSANAATNPYVFQVLDYGYIDIRWLTTSNTIQGGILLAGTTDGLYALVGSEQGGGIIPNGIISARRQSAVGCADIQGVIVNNYLIFPDITKRTLRMAQFNLQQDQFVTPEITIFARHLFDADIKEIHYQRSPYSILWVILEDGTLLSFSSTPDGGVSAWTRHEFADLTVESMAVLRKDDEDVPLLWVKDGADYYVLQMQPYRASSQDEMFFSDQAVRQYNATAFTTVTGLDHLDGEEVVVWADGAAHPPRTVESGSITLNREANTAIVGKAFTAEIETLPIPEQQAKIKRVNKIFARFFETLGAEAGEDPEEIVPFRAGDFVMGSQPEVFTGQKEIPYSGGYDFDGTIRIISETPTPFTLLSVETQLEVYG